MDQPTKPSDLSPGQRDTEAAPGLVDETLESLRAAGRRGTEGVVLWLAKRPLTDGVAIAEAYVPEHYAEVDVFRIPPSSMTAMMAHLRERKLGLAAQVHSHPNRAFHSRADDAWAIVRHRAGSPDIFKMLSAPRASLEGEQ